MRGSGVNCLTPHSIRPGRTCSESKRKSIPKDVPKHGPRLWIRTASGPSIGFGHLRRSLILARKIRARMKPLFLLDKSDCGSREQVRAAGFEFTRFDPALLIRASSFPVGLLIDTREKRGLQSLIRDLQCQSIPVISIHDLGLAPLPSDVVIDGSLQPGSPISGPNGARHYMGPDYLVIEPDSSIRERAGPMPAAASKIVVGLGGGDTRFSFRRVLEALRRTRKELSILGIPGYSRWGQEELSREPGASWHLKPSALECRFAPCPTIASKALPCRSSAEREHA